MTENDFFERVCYESGRVQVCVWHADKSYDRDVDIQLLTDPKETFRSADVQELATGNRPGPRSGQQRNDQLTAWVADEAERLRLWGDRVLRGDAIEYECLRKQATVRGMEAGKRYAERQQWRAGRLARGEDPDQAMRVRTRVVAAFGREDWHDAVRLFESIDRYLTPLEREQLAYARARAAESTN